MTVQHVLPDPTALCRCGGELTDVRGMWRHIGPRGCGLPEPMTCAHLGDWACEEPADITVHCLRGKSGCCGCCLPVDDRDL